MEIFLTQEIVFQEVEEAIHFYPWILEELLSSLYMGEEAFVDLWDVLYLPEILSF